MPIEFIPETDFTYYLVSFDADGAERRDDPSGPMSDILENALASQAGPPVSDVFLISHGWKGDYPAAKEQYAAWTTAMTACRADIERLRGERPDFNPLVVGLHWPSLPWGDEDLRGGSIPDISPVERAVNRYAERIADTPTARDALRTILDAARLDADARELPASFREAYEILDLESGLGADGAGAAPGRDREPFDPELVLENELVEYDQPDFGGVDSIPLLSPLRQLSFWKMKDRARQIGESGGHALLNRLQSRGEHVRFHLMGHSFGCIVMSATVRGPSTQATWVRPVNSLFLVQGALSLWSYCSRIPDTAAAGYFHSLVESQRVAGPIVVTRSNHDHAVGRLYPIGSGLARQVAFAPDGFPKYGALGAFGAQGPGVSIVEMKMKPTHEPYSFEIGRFHNLDATRFICDGGGLSGAHNDIAKPEVAHAFWEAARFRP